MLDIISWFTLDASLEFGMIGVLMKTRMYVCYGACDLLGGDG